MTKKPIIMLIDDAPIPDVEMAKAAEHHARTTEFGRLCNEGHVRVVQTENPKSITVEIEGEKFTCRREIFPSTKLMARLQLAVAAGQSNRNVLTSDHHVADSLRYAMRGLTADKVWTDERWLTEDTVAIGYSNVAKKTRAVTATVKPMKGVRP